MISVGVDLYSERCEGQSDIQDRARASYSAKRVQQSMSNIAEMIVFWGSVTAAVAPA